MQSWMICVDSIQKLHQDRILLLQDKGYEDTSNMKEISAKYDDSDENEESESDDEDEEAELMRELELIRQEREQERLKKV